MYLVGDGELSKIKIWIMPLDIGENWEPWIGVWDRNNVVFVINIWNIRRF